MKRLSILMIVAALAVSCSSTDSDQPYGRRGGYGGPRGDDGAAVAANRPLAGNLDMLPPTDWWRQPMLADAVRVTPDQVAALEKISQDQGNDVSRIESDMTIAVRDLRTQLDATQASSADIITAGQRIRALRDSMFDRQLNMLAAERTVLSVDQWHTLQQQLQDRRQQRQNDYGYPRRGGRGMGGRGRWPGYGVPNLP
jgi:hypothetical protein